jgi:hypothetical protein
MRTDPEISLRAVAGVAARDPEIFDHQRTKGGTVQRNDLITHLSRTDNDSVVVNVNGVLIDVEGVRAERDSVVLVINQDDLLEILTKIADCRMPIQRA